MSYIGKIPATGNFVKLDAISVVNGQAGYTMQSSSVNFTPESANHMLVSLNGVIQAPISSFTVSGSTITFASALSTGDVIDFIMVYGNVLDIGTPSDNTVSTAKLVDTSVTSGKLATDSVIEAKIQNDAVTRDKINAISTSSLPSFEAKGTSGQTDGYIQLNCEQNSHGIKLKSPPHSAGQSYTLTFPSTAPATDKFLKTNSSGVLSFADAGGGSWNLISTTTISSDATVTVSGLDSTYVNYVMILNSIHPASNDVYLNARAIISGSPYTTSNYFSIIEHSRTGNASNEFDNNEGYSHWMLTHDGEGMGNGNADSLNMIINIYNPSGTTFEKQIQTQAVYNNAMTNNMTSRSYSMNAIHSTSPAFTGIQFYFSSGNMDTGTIKLYGIS